MGMDDELEAASMRAKAEKVGIKVKDLYIEPPAGRDFDPTKFVICYASLCTVKDCCPALDEKCLPDVLFLAPRGPQPLGLDERKGGAKSPPTPPPKKGGLFSRRKSKKREHRDPSPPTPPPLVTRRLSQSGGTATVKTIHGADGHPVEWPTNYTMNTEVLATNYHYSFVYGKVGGPAVGYLSHPPVEEGSSTDKLIAELHAEPNCVVCAVRIPPNDETCDMIFCYEHEPKMEDEYGLMRRLISTVRDAPRWVLLASVGDLDEVTVARELKKLGVDGDPKVGLCIRRSTDLTTRALKDKTSGPKRFPFAVFYSKQTLAITFCSDAVCHHTCLKRGLTEPCDGEVIVGKGHAPALEHFLDRVSIDKDKETNDPLPYCNLQFHVSTLLPDKHAPPPRPPTRRGPVPAPRSHRG